MFILHSILIRKYCLSINTIQIKIAQYRNRYIDLKVQSTHRILIYYVIFCNQLWFIYYYNDEDFNLYYFVLV